MFIGRFAYEWVGKLSVFLINLDECNSLFSHLFRCHHVRHRLQFILEFVAVIVVILVAASASASAAAAAVDDAIVF